MTTPAGETVKIRPLARNCCLPLCPVENAGGFRYELLRGNPLLEEVFRILDGPLENLFVRQPPLPKQKVVSRGFLQQDLAIVRSVCVPPPPGTITQKFFKVEKANGLESRLVQNLSSISACLSPPRVPFCPLHLLFARLLRHDAVMLADLKNWFYQIAVPASWRRWFGVRLAAGRGEFTDHALFVLSMGLGVSVFLAHMLALAVARAAATAEVDTDAWVDNVFWAGPPAALDAVAANLADLKSRLAFEWSSPPAVSQTEFVFVGLRFCLREKTVSPTEKLRTQLAVDRRRLLDQPTLRTALSVVGLLLWLNWAVARCPLAFCSSLLEWLARCGGELSSLDLRVVLPPPVLDDIARLSADVAAARLSASDLADPLPPTVSVFSDASDFALAAVIREGGSAPSVRTWPADPATTIFAREALAFLLAVRAVPRGVPAEFAVDNLGLFFAARKGHSRSDFGNEVLREFFRVASPRLRIAFVRSRANLADFPSRGRALPPSWAEFFAQVVSAPLPFFRVPSWGAGS